MIFYLFSDVQRLTPNLQLSAINPTTNNYKHLLLFIKDKQIK
jgi:hypothetical protein